jgi:hypothetical protein
VSEQTNELPVVASESIPGKDLHQYIISIVNGALSPFRTIHSFGMVLIMLLVLGGLGSGGYFLFINHKDTQQTREDMQVLKAQMVTMNQPMILLKVINDNLRDSKEAKLGSAPIDEKVATSKMLYDMATLEGVPLHILCGIAETESNWNTHAVSEAGCLGLLQVTPAYARLCLSAKGIDYKPGIWFNPVINVMCGVKMLSNNQAEHLENGRTQEGNWTLAIHSYFWGPSNTILLFGKKDQRVNVPNLAYPQRIVDASKKYKDLGL